MLRHFSNPYFATADDAGSGGMSQPLSKDDIIDYLDEDDKNDDVKDKSDELDDEDEEEPKPKSKPKDKTDKKKEPKPKDKEPDSDDESDSDEEDDEELDLDELEESLEAVDEDKLELVTPVSRAKILKKYPTLFKDFPYLEKAYFREQQFTEIFSHPDDARQAFEKAGTLDKFESDLFSGNTETILRVIKNDSPKSFAKLVDNYMPTLARIDKEAHNHVIGNTIKQTIMAMVKESRVAGNESLGTAAQILNQFVFASSEFQPPSSLTHEEKPEEVDEEKVQLRNEKTALIRERFNDSRTELNTRVNNSIKATIEQNIDPRGSMTDYVKRTAIREAMEQVEKSIDADKRFKSIVDKLWEKSYHANFSKTSVETIRSAYMSKAKTLLDSVIKKSRNEALKGMGKRVSEDKNTNTKSSRRDQSSDDERPRSRNSSGKSSDIPRGMSSLEFLMKDDD